MEYAKIQDGIRHVETVDPTDTVRLRSLQENGWERVTDTPTGDVNEIGGATFPRAAIEQPPLTVETVQHIDPATGQPISVDEHERNVWNRARGEHMAGRIARGDVRDPLPDGSAYYAAPQQNAAYRTDEEKPQGVAVRAFFTINNVYVQADFPSMDAALEWFTESLKGIQPPTTITFTTQHAAALG